MYVTDFYIRRQRRGGEGKRVRESVDGMNDNSVIFTDKRKI